MRIPSHLAPRRSLDAPVQVFVGGSIASWEGIPNSLKSCSAWNAGWFGVSRRFFLYGGGKHFNPTFDSEVDRVVDYTAALEAAFVPEQDFVSRRLRERVIRLLQMTGAQESSTRKLLNRIYGIRSTLVHGSPLSPDQLEFLRDSGHWLSVETLVRDSIVAALRAVPPDETTRRSYLKAIYDIDDDARAEKILDDFRAIRDSGVRTNLLSDLRKHI